MTRKPLLAFFILAVSAFGTGAYVESNPAKEESVKSAGPVIAAVDSYKKGKGPKYEKKSNPKPPPLPPRSTPGGIWSDIRLKRDIHLLATLDDGMKIYAFKYLWSETDYVGVMAQDLLANPAWRDRVITSHGFYAVNYGALGLKMVTLEQWQVDGFI